MEDVLFSELGTLESCENRKGLLIRDSEIKSVSSLKQFIAKNNISLIVYKVAEGKHLEQMIRQRVPTVCYGAEFHSGNDHGHQANSGLDKPLVELMKKKGCTYGFSITCLTNAMNTSKFRLIIPRVAQNLMLVTKYDCDYVVMSGKKESSLDERKRFLQAFTSKSL
jgi:hypothetical protein